MAAESKKERWKEERETRRRQFEQEEHKRKLKQMLVWGSVILAGFIIAFFIYNKVTDPGQYDTLAKCISEKGMVMYGTNWCPHCQRQKELFGNSFKYVNFVDCDVGTTCDDVGVQSYPTWAKDGTLFEPGIKSLAELATLTGCQSP